MTYGLCLILVGFTTACDPPPEPADGELRLVNTSSDPIVVTFDYGDEPSLERMWETRRRLVSTPPGETSQWVQDTYLEGDANNPSRWCLPGSQIIVLLRPVDGESVDGLDTDYALEQFEIVDHYGPNYCVDSETAEIRYRGADILDAGS